MNFDTAARIASSRLFAPSVLPSIAFRLASVFLLPSLLLATPDAFAQDNTAPDLDPIGDKLVNELAELSFTATASDDPGDVLTFELTQAPPGASIGPGTGIFTWTPTEAQGPGSYQVTVRVRDNGVPILDASETITVTVNEVNVEPVLDAIGNQSVEQESLLTFTATANDNADIPANNLTFDLTQAPPGASISSTGVFTWTPTTTQGPGDFQVTVRVTDNGTPNLSDSETITVSVSEDNTAPVLAPIGDRSVDELTQLSFTATATDDPGDTLTFSLDGGAPPGASIGPGTGIFTWTPTEAQGPDSVQVTVRVTDNGTPALDDSETITITVNEVNVAPVANNDNPPSIDEGGSITNSFNVLDNDTDADDNALTAELVDGQGPANADNFSLNSNGNFVYRHDGSDTTSDSFTYEACDDGTPRLCDTATVTISINSVNDDPVAVNDGPGPVFTLDEGGLFDSGLTSVLDNDTDAENDPLTAALVTPPVNDLAFTLNPDGTFTYTHDGSETVSDSFTYRAEDDNGGQSNVATVTLTINPVNDAPTFIGVLPPGLSTPEDTTLTITVASLDISDPDNVPADFVLTLDPVLPPDANYTLAGPASITPAENYNGDLSVRATVNDGLDDSAPFLIPVTITAENDLPVLEAEIGPQTAIEDAPFELNVSTNFSDADGDTLAFSISPGDPEDPLPVGLTVDSVNGVLSYLPPLEDARDNDPYMVTVTATDPAGASVSDEFDLTVSALNRSDVGLSIGVTPESGLPNDQLTWTFTAANPIGPAPGENVELSGSFFGDGLSVAAGSGASCSITLLTGRADFVCTIGALPVGDEASINFTTTASEATEVVAFGTAAGAQRVPIDPNIANNSAVRAVGVAESFSNGAVQFLGDSTIRSVAAGDFDGDGRPDLIVGTAAGEPVQVYLGDEPRESCGCQRDFVATPISVPDTGSNEGIAVADFDNDGNLDFVVANGGGQPDVVYHNTGAGNFAISAVLELPNGESSNGRDVAVGDFNNDGNMDIAIAATSPNSVYFGDGAGGFGDAILLGDAESFDVAVGRFDDDQFDDLVFANVGSDSQVWINDGGTGFTPGTLLTIGDAISVAAADLNGDNLDDLVFGRIPGGSDDVPANPVMINQGGAAFGDSPVLLGLSPTADVLIGDVSDDGVPDIVFINASGLHQTWVADGAGYTLHGEQIIDIDARVGVLANLGFADTDDPGGIDLALGGAIDAGAAVYLNDSIGNLGLGDAVPPVISLNGNASVNVPAGTAYADAGASATDNIDGDVSGSIVVNNPVNSAVVGAYTVTYNVQDFAGNDAVQVTRTVNVTAATGRGGGGGGTVSYWALALLVAAQLLVLSRTRRELQRRKIEKV
jgi:VCBS repeat-containing protein